MSVRESVTSVLGLSEELTSQECNQLEYAGVESVADLPLVEPSDLAGILKPIQIQKLLKVWQQGEACN